MAVNKVEYGDTVLLDLTNDTVSGDTLLEGVTAHDASGEVVEGTVNLNNYYTKPETDALIPDISNLATKGEIPSLQGYATEWFVNEVVRRSQPDLSDYATTGYVTQQINGIDFSNYATKGDIPNITGLATEGYVTASINAAKPDLSGYALKSEIPSISGLATEGYVNQKIAAIPAPDLSSYAKKSDVPSIAGLASTSYVDTEVDKVMQVANGKTKTYVFNTVAELDNWLAVAANKTGLNNGDVFLIKAVNVPDYWWDGTGKSILETTKVDLSGYALTANVPSIKVNNATNADTASNSLKVGGYTIVISSTAPTNASNTTITFVTG